MATLDDLDTALLAPLAAGTGATLIGYGAGTVAQALAATAPLASPALTGTPTAPTATAGTNTTQIATTAFVVTAIAGLVGGLNYAGTWNASTNTPTLASGVGTKGTLYKVSVAGTTTLDGISSWSVGDMALFDGTTWDKIDGQSTQVVSFNDRIGAVVLQASDVTGVGGALLASPTFTGTPAAPTAAPGTNTTQLATTAFVTTSFAPLASPALTGTPTAPTAAPGTNTTQIATTAFVAAAVAAGTAGVASFNTRTGAVTLQASDVTGVGGALLASPAFTGTVTAPTPTTGTNTTQVATTAFVNASIAANAYSLPAATTSTLGGVIVGSGLSVTAGTVTANVTTVAGRTGAITLAVADVSGAAPLASPTFTGTPAAPTATAGTNTTQIATTAFVTAAIASISTGVSSFNTRTGAVTLQAEDVTDVGGALLASPTFTGTPAAPTAAAGTDTTQLATTAFVYNATQATGGVALTNANVTLSAAQYGNAIINFTGTLTGNVVITFPSTGQWTLFNNTTGAFTVTVTNGSGGTFAIPQGATMEVVSSGSTGMQAASDASPVRFQSPAYSYNVVALGSVSGTQTLDLGAASEFTMTITGATTIAFTNTLRANQSEVIYLRLTNAGGAGNSIAWPASTKFAGGTAPTFTASGVDLVGVKYDTTTSTYMVFVVGLAVA